MLSTFLQFTQVGKISEICDDKDKDQNDNPHVRKSATTQCGWGCFFAANY